MKNTLKRVLCALLVTIFLFANANVALAAGDSPRRMARISPTLHRASRPTTVDITEYVGDTEAFQAYIFSQLKTDVPYNNEGHIDVSEYNIPFTNTAFHAICDFLWYESPELFRLGSIGCTSGGYNGDIIGELTPLYNYEDPEDYIAAFNLMEANATKLLEGIEGNNDLTDVEKALLIHDRVALFCEYDMENLENDTLPEEAFNAYGVLGEGIAVCMGYALAYDYLLERVGIKSDYCSSEVLCHAWNVVYIDNKPYHVDITWDDPVEDTTGRVKHDNFLRSTEGIKATGHVGETWYQSNVVDYITSPTDTKYDNYFWQESLAEFQLLNGKIYYMNNNLSQEGYGMRKGQLIELDGINDTSPTVLKEVYEYWCEDAEQTSRWQGNFSKLASGHGMLFYNSPRSIYAYNPVTGDTQEIVSPEFIYEETGNRDLSIFGMDFNGCLLVGEFSTTPYYERDTKRENYFAVAYHNPQENWDVIQQPTANEEGIEVNLCVECGAEKERRSIPPVGNHNWSDWYIDPDNRPTCTEAGRRIKSCQDAGCTAQLWERVAPLGHDYQTSWTVDIAPTCVTKGEKSHHCTRCTAKTDITEMPATGEHVKSSTWIVGKPATCSEEGFEYRVCINCGREAERKVLNKLSHQLVTVNFVQVTCTVNGYTGDTVCNICGTVTKAGTSVPAQGHKTSEWIVDCSSSPSAPGLRHKECTVCKTVLVTEEIPYVDSLPAPAVTTANTANGIKVYWNQISNVEKYVVYRRVYNKSTKKYSGWTVVKDNFTGNEYIDSDVSLGTIYSYAVRAVNGDVKSNFKATKGLTFNFAPTVKVANATNGTKVSWSKVQGVKGYIVYSSTYNAKTKKWSSWKNRGTTTATSWTDKSVKNATYYKYTVRAVNGSVKSSYNKSGVKTCYLVAPTVKIANAGSGVNVSWNKISGAKKYTVYRAEVVNGKWSSWKNIGSVSSSALSYVDKTAKSGVNYKYTVRAVNGSYISSYKSSSGLLRLAQPNVTIANASTGVKVSWNKVAGATGYTVYSSYYNASTKKWSGWSNRGTAEASKTSWVDKKVKSGTYYKYTVKAVNGKTASSYKASDKILFLAEPVLKTEESTNGVRIGWQNVAGAKGYKVYRKSPSATKWTNIGSTTKNYFTDSSSDFKAGWVYTVRAYNGSYLSSFNKEGVQGARDCRMVILDLVNKERAKAGVHKLEYYYEGQPLADTRVEEISRYFSHTRPDGREWHTVFDEYGIYYETAVGENIASGHRTPEEVMEAWMNSPGHRSNILDPDYDMLVVGYDAEERGWVQLFIG